MAVVPEQPVRSESPGTVELPAATSWPLVLAIGIALLGAGLATSYVLSIVGGAIFVVGLAGWIGELLPGHGQAAEPLAPVAARARPISGAAGKVDFLEPGRPGYRFRLPLKVHPVSAGVKGGILGGLVMPIPALLYGLSSGKGIWFPVNLLAGVVLPGANQFGEAQLGEFSILYFVVGLIIHATFSVGFGLIYGVVLPTLPSIRGGPIIWGGILMPILWTWMCYGLMGVVNPLLEKYVEWHWFLVSQFVYGLAMSWVVYRSEKVYAEPVRGGGPGEALDHLAGTEREGS